MLEDKPLGHNLLWKLSILEQHKMCHVLWHLDFTKVIQFKHTTYDSHVETLWHQASTVASGIVAGGRKTPCCECQWSMTCLLLGGHAFCSILRLLPMSWGSKDWSEFANQGPTQHAIPFRLMYAADVFRLAMQTPREPWRLFLVQVWTLHAQ